MGIVMSALPPQVATFVVRQRIAYLATADASGRPHVVPICFALGGEVLYTVIDRKPKRLPLNRLRRVRNLRQNPYAAIVVNTYAEDWSRLGHVLLGGNTRILTSGPEHAAALQSLREKYKQYRTMSLKDRLVIAVTITRVAH